MNGLLSAALFNCQSRSREIYASTRGELSHVNIDADQTLVVAALDFAADRKIPDFNVKSVNTAASVMATPWKIETRAP